jgi:secreted Zn-dependent insulinase-like peptidase
LFLIQSDSFDPLHVDERIEAFIERLRTKIMTMGDEEFQSNITALSQSCLEKNKNIGEESNKYWNAICNNHYLFKRLNLIAAHLETTSKSQVLRFFDKYIAKGSPHRRKLSVQVFAKPHMEKYESPVPDGVSLFYSDKVDGFKQSMPLFPLSEKVDLGSFKVSQNEDS